MKKPQLIRLVIILAVGLVGVGAIMFVFSSKRASAFDMLTTKADQIVPQVDGYRKNKEYIDNLLVYAKPIARQKADPGMFAPTVDESAYFTELFDAMRERADHDSQSEVASRLRSFALGRNYIHGNGR